jgi:prepilin-type N-terminal cleavage/methylation domain-containing protein
MLQRNSRDAGLTLIELIVTIALVAVVASIALPVFHDLVGNQQTKANSQSSANRTQFTNDWTASGFAPDSTGNVIIGGTVVASIAQDGSSNSQAVVTGQLDLASQGWNKLPSFMTGSTSSQTWSLSHPVLRWISNFGGYSYFTVADAQAAAASYLGADAATVNPDGSVSAGSGRGAVRFYNLLSDPEAGVANITTLP